MYNKIFTKILDSSIWLETDTTRLVWITMLAAMDEDGFCQFASVANLARRAVVDLDKCTEAVRVLENPDTNSADPDNEGRRIERVPGGWMVLNAQKYRELVTRIISREKTRVRVAKHRLRNGAVTPSNESVTPSEAVSESKAESENTAPSRRSVVPSLEEWMAAANAMHPDWPVKDAEGAWNYYEAQGWKRGKSPIVRWKACIATCYGNWNGRGRRSGTPISAEAEARLNAF